MGSRQAVLPTISVSPTFRHLGILDRLGSPWVSAELVAAQRSGSRSGVELAFRRAMKGLTVEQLAEFMFVASHAPDELETLLNRGRAEFTKAAMDFVLQQVSRPELDFVAANAPDLIRADHLDNVA